MRRIVMFLSSLFAFVAALASTGSAAFAVRVVPPAGGSAANVGQIGHHASGLEAWQIALIALAGVVVLAATALASRLMRAFRRPASRPATT